MRRRGATAPSAKAGPPSASGSPPAREREHVDKAIAAFTEVGQKYDILGKSMDEIVEKYGL